MVVLSGKGFPSYKQGFKQPKRDTLSRPKRFHRQLPIVTVVRPVHAAGAQDGVQLTEYRRSGLCALLVAAWDPGYIRWFSHEMELSENPPDRVGSGFVAHRGFDSRFQH